MKDRSPAPLARQELHKATFEAALISLEQLREGLGISQEALASVMEVRQPPARRWFAGPTRRSARCAT